MIELKTRYINNIRYYYINNNKVNKKELLNKIKELIKINNNLYYKELIKNNFDYKKTYYNYNGFIMNYKQVKKDILQNGLIYTFYISLDISK